MAQFTVLLDDSRKNILEEEKLAKELRILSSQICDVKNALAFEIRSKQRIYNRLNSLVNDTSEQASKMKNMESGLREALNLYERTETKICNKSLNTKDLISSFAGAVSTEFVGTDKSYKTVLNKIKGYVGKAGVVGGVFKTIMGVIGSDSNTETTWAKAISDIWSPLTKITKTIVKTGAKTVSDKGTTTNWSKKFAKNLVGYKDTDPDVSWLKALTGTYADPFLMAMKNSGLSTSQKIGCSFAKAFKGEIRKFKISSDMSTSSKIGAVSQYGSIALSALVNGLQNKEEYESGKISKERAIAETVTETAVDWGKNILITGAVTAGFAAAGFAAPALLVGAGVVAVSTGADAICKWATKKCLGEEKSVTEFLSDGIIDVTTTAAKAVQKGVSTAWSGIKNGWNNLFNNGETLQYA